MLITLIIVSYLFGSDVIEPYVWVRGSPCPDVMGFTILIFVFKRQQHNQRPPGTPQRQRHHPAKEWSDLQAQAWQGRL